MPNNLLDKLTWNFIHERQVVDGSDYIKSIITKLEVILSKNVSHSVRSNLKTALEDLKKVNFSVTKLKETVKDLESENKKLKTKLEKLEAKSKSTKEE